MKHLLIFATIALLISSCKKDRTCECTVSTFGITTTHIKTDESTGAAVDTTIIVPLSNSNKTEIDYKDVSKKKAKFNCISRDETFSESYPNGIPGLGSITITNSGTREYDCELK